MTSFLSKDVLRLGRRGFLHDAGEESGPSTIQRGMKPTRTSNLETRTGGPLLGGRLLEAEVVMLHRLHQIESIMRDHVDDDEIATIFENSRHFLDV